MRQRFGLFVQHRVTHLDSRLTLERPGAGQHLVKQDAGGKNIRARIDSIAARLLGRGVRSGAVGHADFGNFRVMNSRRSRRVFVQQFRQTKVENFNLAVRRDHHVAGLDVAMDDTASVRGGKCIGSLQSDRQSTLERQRATVHELPHVSTLDVLHGDEVNAIDLVEVEDGADVWVVQRGSEARFTFKTFEVCFACGQFGGQNFDNQGAAEFGIDGFIDSALSALTELLENLIIP